MKSSNAAEPGLGSSKMEKPRQLNEQELQDICTRWPPKTLRLISSVPPIQAKLSFFLG